MSYIPLKPIPIKDRTSMLFVGKSRIDVRDGAFVTIDESDDSRVHIPIGSLACLLLEPGARISHSAIKLAATTGTLVIWVGDAGVRLYSAGQPGGARSDKLLYQAKLALDDSLRLKVARKMFELRFGEPPPQRRSIEQLRGIEGARVKATYSLMAKKYNIKWSGRRYDAKNWDSANDINRCISGATSCLYGVTEAAVLAAGYAPAIGFVHSGKPLSFVYDIADIIKFDTVVPIAFQTASSKRPDKDRQVRIACREIFRSKKVLKRLIPLIEEVLSAGEIEPPTAPIDSVPPALPEPVSIGDAGHRSG